MCSYECFRLRMLAKLIILLLTAGVSCQNDPTTEGSVSCKVKKKDWITDDNMQINWTVPEYVIEKNNLSDMHAVANWKMDENSGPCMQVTVTTCTMKYGERNTVDFSSEFNFTVTLENSEGVILWFFNKWIDPVLCHQPPKVGTVLASPLTSSCLKVMWYYTVDQVCTSLGMSRKKIYRLSYRVHESENSTWSVVIIRTERKTACNGSYMVCGLLPYTEYEIGIECKNINYSGVDYGLWSEMRTVVERTDEDVPSGTPEVAVGGFFYDRKDCDDSRKRHVTFYWKNVPQGFRQGEIKGFKIDISEMKHHVPTKVKTYEVLGQDTLSSTVILPCSISYLVTLKAFTVKGASENSSAIFIPRNSLVLDIDLDVVPVIQERSKDIQLEWVIRSNITSPITAYTVYMCEKTLDGKCKSHIMWTILPPKEHHYLLKAATVLHSPHKYIYGISVQSYNRTSAIRWTSCLYTKDTDIQPPREVRFIANAIEGMLQAHWDNPSCESGPPAPYIFKFIASICDLGTDTQNNCSGASQSKEVDGHANNIIFTGLDPSRWYGLHVQAVSLSGENSSKSEFIIGKPYKDDSGWEGRKIALLVTGLVIVSILTSVGCCAIVRPAWNRLNTPGPEVADILQLQDKLLSPGENPTSNGIPVTIPVTHMKW